MGSLLTEISVDCHDPGRLARWWAEVLGWSVMEDPRGFSWISATGRHEALPRINFLPVPESKAVKNRVHLDVSPTELDHDGELQRLLGLGAARVDVGQGDDATFVVLADPEGNEFCLLGRPVAD